MDAFIEQYTIRLHEKGQLTLPPPVREGLDVEQDDLLTIVRIGDNYLIVPKRLHLPALADQFAREMDEAGVTMEELLEGLEEERAAIYQERYASRIKHNG